jgi:hypothetical protein
LTINSSQRIGAFSTESVRRSERANVAITVEANVLYKQGSDSKAGLRSSNPSQNKFGAGRRARKFSQRQASTDGLIREEFNPQFHNVERHGTRLLDFGATKFSINKGVNSASRNPF